MELILFVIAVIVGYILFITYKPAETSNRCEQPPPTPTPSRKIQEFKKSSIFSVLGFSTEEVPDFETFGDQFESFEEVSVAMKTAGMESLSLVIGIDFTASNEWQGKRTFSRHCLHKLHGVWKTQVYNPYQRVIAILGKTLQPFTNGKPIHVYGFGDVTTQDYDVFPFNVDCIPCFNFKEVLHRYNQIVRRVTLSGPTSYAPIIRKAIEHVKRTKDYHVLIIIADGQIKEDGRSLQAILEASHYPLSIVCIGVGDGPWNFMENFDDFLPIRKFDNFHFVNFHHIVTDGGKGSNAETAFALAALMKVPDQYQAILRLGYFKEDGLFEDLDSSSESE